MPAKHRAFYPGRHVGDILQYGGFLQFFPLFLGNTSLDHLEEQVCQMQRFLLASANDQLQHHVRGSLGYGTAVAFEGTVNYHTILHFQLQKNVITTAGINALQHQIRILQLVLVIRMQIVLRQDFIIKCLILHSPSVSLSLQGFLKMPESLLPYCRHPGLLWWWTILSNVAITAGHNDVPPGPRYDPHPK